MERQRLLVVFAVVLSFYGVSPNTPHIRHKLEEGDTPIWPIPTSCPEVDSPDYSVQLQHEFDCAKFYKCDHGEKVLWDCPPGLEFSALLQVCVWPYDANCILGDGDGHDGSDGGDGDGVDNGDDGGNENEGGNGDDGNGGNGGDDNNDGDENRDPDCPYPDPLNETLHLPHESNCSLFYKCNNGHKVLLDCPDGLVFNPELQVCDYPSNVAGCGGDDNGEDGGEGGSSNDGGDAENGGNDEDHDDGGNDKDPDCPYPDPLNETVHLPHESNCSLFYKCDNGHKVLFDCPDGLVFNPELQVCDYPSNVAGCGGNGNGEDGGDGGNSNDGGDGENGGDDEDHDDGGNDRDPDCPYPDPLNETVHLPHESNCSLFYKCDNGHKVLFDCPDGLVFNPELQVCDYPSNVAGCGGDGHGEDGGDGGNNDDGGDDGNGGEGGDGGNGEEGGDGDDGENDRDPDCPYPDPLNETLHLPHESNCSLFYKCDNGHKVLFDCPDGLVFNPELQVCDYPSNVAGCGGDGNGEDGGDGGNGDDGGDGGNGEGGDDGNGGEGGDGDDGENDRDPDCPYPDPLNETLHLPHESNCSLFYKCDNGHKVLFDCPDGLVFNPELQVCDYPSNVAGCGGDGNGEDGGDGGNGGNGGDGGNGGEGGHGDDGENDRDPDCPFPDPLNETVHLPHGSNCSLFYKCDNGHKVLFDCPDGLVFNPELQVCDYPSNVAGCGGDGNGEDGGDGGNGGDGGDGGNGGEGGDGGNGGEGGHGDDGENDRDPDCPFPDPLNETVHLPHGSNCSLYYKCDNGHKVLFDCPDGLVFNPELEVCDYPSNVAGCGGGGNGEDGGDGVNDGDGSNECNVDCEDTTRYLPHSNKHQYRRCDKGVMVVETCPGDLYFDAKLATCNLQHLIES